MTEQIKRQTAFKFWIKDILNGEAKVDERGMRYFLIKDKRALRVNILAHVIQKYINEERTYGTLVLDDGSSQIRLKAWADDMHLLEKLEIGQGVLVVGKLAESNDEIFIRPEITRLMENPDWDLVRKLELHKMYGKPEERAESESPVNPSVVVEERVEDNPIKPSIAAREKIVALIEKDSNPQGSEIAVIIEGSGLKEEDAESALSELLSEGEAYEPKPGFIKLIE